MRPLKYPCLSVFLLFFSGLLVAAQLELDEDQGLTGFGLALRRLPTVGSLLYITAHPDDENNAVLARVSRGQGIRTALLSLTRGDGGQNEIGPELFEALGVLRTQELMRVHRFDAAHQFFTRAYEFGYSYSVEETLEKWGEDVLRDVVRVIRQFRPDVVLSLNPQGTGGGQHHQASARLAEMAFVLASDPSQFPQQLADGLRIWRPSRLFQTSGVGMGTENRDSIPEPVVSIEVGAYDELLGESYAEFGARARTSHRCQGMNALAQPGFRTANFWLEKGNGNLGEGTDFFQGLDFSLGRVALYDPELYSGLERLQDLIQRVQEDFEGSRLEKAVAGVMEGLALVRDLSMETKNAEARFLLEAKEIDFVRAAKKGHFIYLGAFVYKTIDGSVVPGEEVSVQVRFLSRSKSPASLTSVQLVPSGDWKVSRLNRLGDNNEFRATVPLTASYTQPYWYRSDSFSNLFSVKKGFTGLEASIPAVLKARVKFVSKGVEASLEVPVQYRWFDQKVGHERRMDLQVVPEISISLMPSSRIFIPGITKEKTFQASVVNNRPGRLQTRVELIAPRGWKVNPQAQDLSFRHEGESHALAFLVKPPVDLAPGTYQIDARASVEGRIYSQGYEAINYHHIETRHVYRPARSLARVFKVKVAPIRVGYVVGVGDQVPGCIEDLGLEVTFLDAEDLASGDLANFDVIVTGVRAYLNRRDLRDSNHRILEYVYQGGHLIVQYNKYEFNQNQYGPYPAKISRPHDRVTDENSSVRILEPNDPLLNWPNVISEADWEGWIQERGLYFLGEWDAAYKPLLELQDPFPNNSEAKQGSLVVAKYGKGTYIYTGLGFFRQLPAGVSGAIRLWANLLSLGKAP